jgi:hypothetical protein
MCYCDNGGTHTITNSGVAADTNAHIFGIISTGSTLQYYIDENLVATNSSNLPTANLYPWVDAEPLAASARTINIGRLRLETY